MPRQILFIQGGGEGTHDAWDNKLVASLETELGADYPVHYPLMPDEGDPNYPAWKAAIVRELDTLDEGAILVGHSLGGAFLVQALAEHRPKRRWGAVLLITAPFFGAGGWPDDDIDPRKLTGGLAADIPVFLYHGTADNEVPPAHMALYAAAIPHATTRALADRDHQIGNDLGEIANDIRALPRR